MLVELIIRNFIIIEELKVELFPKLNILTGETGTGKSIIMNALNLLKGERASSDYIRKGAMQAEIQAAFNVENFLHDDLIKEFADKDDSVLLMKRIISTNGKSINKINNQLVPLSIFREIGQKLLLIHGQHDQQNLLQNDNYLKILDLFIEKQDENFYKLKKEYSQIFNNLQIVKKRLDELDTDDSQKIQQIDYLNFQIAEIAKADLKQNEDLELENIYKQAINNEKIKNNLFQVNSILDNEKGILSKINEIINYIYNLQKYGVNIEQINNLLQSAYYSLEEANLLIIKQKDYFSEEHFPINEIEERLNIINKLKRKYGGTIEKILQYYEKLTEELNSILNKEEKIKELEKEKKILLDKIILLAQDISNYRKNWSVKLTEILLKDFIDLNLKEARFKIEINWQENEQGIKIDNKKYRYHSNGIDYVDFLFSANPGEELKTLAKVASGGELSRIMLGLQNLFSSIYNNPTLIFDEIDTGISGITAQVVAEKLAAIANKNQVIAITHLPQVAAVADHHFLIEKNIIKNKTYTNIKLLSEKEKIEEISRLISGKYITDLTLEHAKELILKAKSQH